MVFLDLHCLTLFLAEIFKNEVNRPLSALQGHERNTMHTHKLCDLLQVIVVYLFIFLSLPAAPRCLVVCRSFVLVGCKPSPPHVRAAA